MDPHPRRLDRPALYPRLSDARDGNGADRVGAIKMSKREISLWEYLNGPWTLYAVLIALATWVPVGIYMYLHGQL